MRKGVMGDILAGTFFGVFLAALLKWLYDNNIWLDQFVTAPNTIEELMLIVIIIFFIISVIVASSRR